MTTAHPVLKLTMPLIVSIIGLTPAGFSHAADTRPNILLIVTDDMGYSDISPFGGEIDTPHRVLETIQHV